MSASMEPPPPVAAERKRCCADAVPCYRAAAPTCPAPCRPHTAACAPPPASAATSPRCSRCSNCSGAARSPASPASLHRRREASPRSRPPPLCRRTLPPPPPPPPHPPARRSGPRPCALPSAPLHCTSAATHLYPPAPPFPWPALEPLRDLLSLLAPLNLSAALDSLCPGTLTSALQLLASPEPELPPGAVADVACPTAQAGGAAVHGPGGGACGACGAGRGRRPRSRCGARAPAAQHTGKLPPRRALLVFRCSAWPSWLPACCSSTPPRFAPPSPPARRPIPAPA